MAPESEGRPSKRQKVPVCAVFCACWQQGRRARGPVGRLATIRDARDAEAVVEGSARRAGSTSDQRPATSDLHLPSPSSPPLQARDNTSPAAMRAETTEGRAAQRGAMNNADVGCVCTGDSQGEHRCRDARDDDHHGLEVPRQLEAGQGQDVSAPGCTPFAGYCY